MSLKIHNYGCPILRKKGAEIKEFDESLRRLSEEMLQLMYQSEGIGLAAQQVGKKLQFCVVDVPDHPELPITCIWNGISLAVSLLMPMSLANPIINSMTGDEYFQDEGCLSFPGINAEVARPDRIIVAYQDLDGIKHTLECDGLLARCIQHEVDHLNGVLFIDRMEKNSYAEIRKEAQALKQDTIKQNTMKKAKKEA